MIGDLYERVNELEQRVRELEDARAVEINTRLEFERMNDVITKEVAKNLERYFKPGGMFAG